MGAHRAARRGVALPLGRPSLEAGKAGAATAAGADLGPQLTDGQLGEQTVHAAHGAEIAAPEALLKSQRPHHGAGGDQQQQTTAQPGGVLEVAHRFPEEDRSETGSEQGGSPAVAVAAGPALRLPAQQSRQPLDDLPPHHEGAKGTPQPSHQGIGEQDQRPPPGPKEVEAAVVGPVLGTQPEPEVHQHEHPAHDPEQQGVPQAG